MAYNTKKGSQHSGDIHFEGDPNDTKIDFENDSIKLKTGAGGKTRLEVNNSHVSASMALSGGAIRTSDAKVSLQNKGDGNKNPQIKIHSDHLYVTQGTSNKNIRIQLGDAAGQSKFQIRDSSDSTLVQIDSDGITEIRNNLTVTGSYLLSGSSRSSFSLRTSAGGYNIAATDNVIIFNHGSGQTATLPQITAQTQGIMYYIKNVGAGAVTVTGSSGQDQLIDSQLTVALSQGDSIKLIGHHIGAGFGWAVLSYYNV